jgi:glycerate kinase
VRALDGDGRELEGRGADLGRVARIDLSGRDPRVADAAIEVACDVVDATFHGPAGAARVFGPQKGAGPEAVERLDAGLATLAAAMRDATGVDVSGVPGAGAAGGAAGGLMALLGATLVPGAPLVLEAVRLDDRLEGAGLCVTGEGRLDETSLEGKAPAAVAAACARAGVPCVALCGEVALGPAALRRAGFAAALPIGRLRTPLAGALARTEEDLAAAGAGLGRLWDLLSPSG